MRKKLFIGIFIVFAISIIFVFSRTTDGNTFTGESEHWKAKCMVSEQRSTLEIIYKNEKEGTNKKFKFSYKFLAGQEKIIIVNEDLDAGQRKIMKSKREGKYQGDGSDYKVIVSWNENEETINLKQK